MVWEREYFIKIGISAIPVVVFFAYYFRNFVFSRNILIQSRAFFWGLIFSVAAILLQFLLHFLDRFLPSEIPSILYKAMVNAALVEEAMRFLFIYVWIKKCSETFTVVEGVFDGILIGLGFAFAENLHYSFANSGFVILLRSVSSVSMHVFLSGIMAFFLSYRRHIPADAPAEAMNPILRRRRRNLMLTAVLIPFFYHAFFDFTLFTGAARGKGNWNYILPFLLIGGFLYLEYLLARARIIISGNILEMLEIDADDMEIIQKQKENERWLHDQQMKNAAPSELIVPKWNSFNSISGFLLIIASAIALHIHAYYPSMLIFDARIGTEALLSLIAWLPMSAGFVLLITDNINYMYFRESSLRLPLATIATLHKGELNINSVVLDVPPHGVFLTDADELQLDDTAYLHLLSRKNKAIVSEGIVRWLNIHDKKLPRGSLFRYIKRGHGFRRYRLLYQWRRFRRAFRDLNN